MSKIWGYNEGDRSELFGRFLLSALGHTTIVERQDDHFGVDLYLKFVKYIGPQKDVYLSGEECAFQIKSNTDPIEINTPDKCTSLYDLNQPLFICVVDRDSKKINIYSTLSRFSVYFAKKNRNTKIIFNEKRKEFFSRTGKDLSIEEIFDNVYCSYPIVTIGYEEFDGAKGAKRRQEIRDVLAFWIEVERKALSWKQHNVVLAPSISDYKTNEVPEGPVDVFNFTTNTDFSEICMHTIAMMDQARITLEMAQIPDDKSELAKSIRELLLFTRQKLESSPNNIFGSQSDSTKNIEYYLSDPVLDASKLVGQS